MQKYFIILLIILLISFFLFTKIEIRIIKRFDRPLLIRVLVFNHIFYQKLIDTPKTSPKTQFKLSYIFDTDLNKTLKKLKEKNFFINIILEYATIKKVTLIPVYSTTNPTLMPYFGFANWMLIATVKKYLEATFKKISDQYYQIILLKDQKGINFELYLDIAIYQIIKGIIKNYKVFLKTIRKREKKYE